MRIGSIVLQSFLASCDLSVDGLQFIAKQKQQVCVGIGDQGQSDLFQFRNGLFIFLFLLAGVGGLDLVRANAVKVFLALGYSVLALIVFLSGDKVAWGPGIALALGNASGGWLGAHVAVRKGEGWIRVVLLAAVLASAVKLTGLGSLALGILRGG